jgi:hypothetical protein
MILLLLASCIIAKDDNGFTDDTATTVGDDTGSTDPDTVSLDGACSDDVHYGAFLVDSNEDYAYVSGSAANAVVPISVLTNVLTTGDCTIWRRENPFCDPSCDPGYTCDFDGTCVPYPEAQDLGTVTIDGLLKPVSMDPVTPGYTYFDTSLPNPPWTPGSVLELHTGGGSFQPVTLYGVAPEDLVATSMDWTLTEGQSFTVTWDPASAGARTEVVLSLSIDQHGVTPSSISCVFADDGTGELPSDVLQSLMDLGVSGFPAGTLTRRTADSDALGSGCIDLQATSSRLAYVTIEGYTPCTRDEDCPDGETCNEEMERCE